MLTRRAVTGVILSVLAMAAGTARAAEAIDSYRGYRTDLTAAPDADRAALLTYIHQQIDLIESIPMSEARKAWFRGVAITINPALDQAGRFRDGKLELDARISPPDNPVLLHEMLHGYHFEVLKPAGRQQEVLDAFQAAKSSGKWPAQAYMLSNPTEFFAMTVSVVLWGQAARPPRTRANLKARAPAWYRWIVREFDLKT